MKERVLPFIGGILLGIAIGIFLVSKPLIELAGSYPLFFALGTSVFTFFAGIFVSKKTTKEEPIRLRGRIFELPQAPVIIEASLRRVGALIPREGEE